jgi:WNK lysine deficient protein kinase
MSNTMDPFVQQDDTGRFICSNIYMGSGASKVVFRGYDRLMGREVAWAQMVPGSLYNGVDTANIEEVQIMSQVSHPNIVKLVKSWIDARGNVIIITDLYGYPLDAFLRQTGAQSMNVIRKWAKQVLSALKHLHEEQPHPIAHRDVKSSNIFLNNYTGDVALGDLGFCAIVGTDRRESIIGTAQYMAPELLRGSHTHLADVYAFGMTLLELATLKTPYSDIKSVAELHAKVLEGQPPDELPLVNDPRDSAVILLCLRDEETRPTAAQLLAHPFFRDEDTTLEVYVPTSFYMHKPQMQRYNSL